MRDLFVIGLFAISIPFALKRPLVAVIVYYWVSIMSPHRYTWGFAYDLPLAMMAALVVFVSVFIHAGELRFPKVRETFIFFILWLFVTISSAASIYPDAAWKEWQNTSKIFLMTLITMMVITNRKQLIQFCIILVGFVGFFAIKGAIFGFFTKGKYAIWGPPASFMSDNNFIGLALVMIIPLCFFLRKTIENRFISAGLAFTGVASIISAALTYSRGAMLGLFTIGLFYVVKSKKKAVVLLSASLILVAGFYMLPNEWFDRLRSVKEYKVDRSALQRINSWIFSYNIARTRALGGGFGCFTFEQYVVHSPDPYLSMSKRDDGTYVAQTAHSIYFEVLAEHGFIGLFVYITALLSILLSLRRLEHRSDNFQNPEIISNLCRGFFVSIMGFMICGAFISRAFFELFWVFFAMIVSMKSIILRGDWNTEENSETLDMPEKDFIELTKATD
jgi:probable O-glycosylation ligase (exosortase A-associated)